MPKYVIPLILRPDDEMLVFDVWYKVPEIAVGLKIPNESLTFFRRPIKRR